MNLKTPSDKSTFSLGCSVFGATDVPSLSLADSRAGGLEGSALDFVFVLSSTLDSTLASAFTSALTSGFAAAFFCFWSILVFLGAGSSSSSRPNSSTEKKNTY